MSKGSRDASDNEKDTIEKAEPEDMEDNGVADDATATDEDVDSSSGEDLTAEERLQEDLQSAKDDYLRLAAEFDNYKKRTGRDFGNLIKTANEGLLVDLLEFIDNFQRALESGQGKEELAAYHDGMKLVFEQMMEILKRHGLAPFDSLGETFDPNLHEALMQTESDEYEPDHVGQEFVKGYKLNDKVIRHAKVGVVGRKDKE